ncbi:MAG: GDSL-type esterase/lipase family protein [Myxococcales bacterium]|nr:GDSL-type esterase/lipase family protein [Myxococcales bacterium]MDD9965562.1 GDSL-type esterase/lipase family protein [Myxococcales bacterium]
MVGATLLLLAHAATGCTSGVRGQPSPANPKPGSTPRPALVDVATELPDPDDSWDAGPDPDAGRAAADAGPESPPPLINKVPLYDPRGDSLEPFYSALRKTSAEGAHTRIAFFGASHVASDMFTDVVRQRLQARFGDGGPGFVLTAKPWRWHRHALVKYPHTRNFKGVRVLARAPKHDRYGLAGVALQSGRLRAISRIATRPGRAATGEVDRVELYYLKQPRGGRVRVLLDGKGLATIRTRDRRPGPGYERFQVPLGLHQLEFRTQADGPVRLFGVVLERSGGGVVLDTLGIPGSRARNHLYWEETLYRAHLKHRAPHLFVLAYGTNEAGDDDVPIEAYESRVANVLDRLRSVLPGAACLLVGPSDRPIKNEEDGSFLPRPRTAQLIAAQQRLAQKKGCAFYDVVAFMGGSMSMLRWNEAKPRLGAPDHIHFTRSGYEALGEALHNAIMEGFDDDAPLTATSEGGLSSIE